MVDDDEVRSLYRETLARWNRRDADGYTALFTTDGHLVGFDGSMIDGQAEIGAHLAGIFADHQPAAYVGKVRQVSALAPDVALLRAVAGMVPPGHDDIDPAVNAVQTIVAVRDAGRWCIAPLQTTPAAFHGRPEASEALTDELRAVLRGDGG